MEVVGRVQIDVDLRRASMPDIKIRNLEGMERDSDQKRSETG